MGIRVTISCRYCIAFEQWRRSVVKSEGLGSLRSSHQTRSRPKFVFVLGAENGLFGHFRLFPFSAENEFSFFFRFRSKMSFAFGRKCYVRNWTVTKFCDAIKSQATFVFVFWPKKEFHFRRHFRPKMKDVFSVGLWFRLRPTTMIFKHSTIPVPDSRLRQTLRGWPGGVLQLAFLPLYPPSDAKHHVLVLQGPGVLHCVQRGQTEISVDDVRCHKWMANQIAQAPLHWRHEPSSIHQVSIADTSCGKPPVYSCRRPRGSMFLYNRAEQTLSVLGTGVLWCWYWENCNSIPSVENCPETYLQRPSSWGWATAGRQDIVSHVHTAKRKVYSLHSFSGRCR